jgi:hypothetical protein
MKERAHLEELGVDGKLILKHISNWRGWPGMVLSASR